MASGEGGRPKLICDSQWREMITERVVKALLDGMPIEKAAEMAGLARTTLHRYRREGRLVSEALGEMELETPDDSFDKYQKCCWEFWTTTRKAELQAINGHVANVTKASQRCWQASAWVLERRLPKEFGRRVELAGNKKKPMQLEVRPTKALESVLEKLSVQQLELLASVAAAAQE